MADYLSFDNKKDLSLYVASLQAQYDQVNALHSEMVSEWENKKLDAIANGETEFAQKLTELLAGAMEMKRKANEHMESLIWARDNLFLNQGGN